MALDFPVHPRLKEPEEMALRALVEREPLLDRTTVATGLIMLGIQVANSPGGFERLLGMLRLRKRPAYSSDSLQSMEGAA